MRNPRFVLLITVLSSLTFSSCKHKNEITQQELARRTQELFDAVSAGDQTPWKKYIADDCLYFDEKGRNMDKAALVADVTPFPHGYSGSISITKVQSRIIGDVAILAYQSDEKETIFGQDLTARYYETDTWLRRNGNWQIVAGQVLRFYEDPAPGAIDAAKYPQYLGTYQLAPAVTLTITAQGDQLFRQRGDHAKELLLPEGPDIFFRKGVEGRILFHRASDGKIDTLIDRRNNEDVVWKKLK